jgi:obg-like ATPase 1
LECLEKINSLLENKWANEEEYNPEEIRFINGLSLLTTKNVVYLVNISEKDFLNKKVNSYFKSVLGDEKVKGGIIIPFSGEHLSSSDASSFLAKIAKSGYKSLNLINFFTCGPDEVKSWTIRRGTKAPQAGGVIHSDFENYFVMAEVMGYEDLKKMGSENEVKKNGKYHHRGKAYVVEDGDVIYFKSNPPKTGSKKK